MYLIFLDMKQDSNKADVHSTHIWKKIQKEIAEKYKERTKEITLIDF